MTVEPILPNSSFHPGQRWVSNTESELGLGIVLSVANRRVDMSFPAAGEKRTYATDNAPLSRVHYEIGQWVSDTESRALLVTEIEEHNGCLIYLGTDEDDQVIWRRMILDVARDGSKIRAVQSLVKIVVGQGTRCPSA